MTYIMWKSTDGGKQAQREQKQRKRYSCWLLAESPATSCVKTTLRGERQWFCLLPIKNRNKKRRASTEISSERYHPFGKYRCKISLSEEYCQSFAIVCEMYHLCSHYQNKSPTNMGLKNYIQGCSQQRRNTPPNFDTNPPKCALFIKNRKKKTYLALVWSEVLCLNLWNRKTPGAQ